MTETEQRAAVVAEALAWVGTAYHHAGRIKRSDDGPGGIDCATLLACVFEAAGMVKPIAIDHYPPDWHMHRSSERYLDQVIGYALEIEEAAALPGDVVLYQWGRVFSHGAIIMPPGWPDIIHAYSAAGAVILDRGDIGRHGYNRPRRFFSPWAAGRIDPAKAATLDDGGTAR